MRFKRYGRFPFEDTSRTRAAVRRKLAAEHVSLPLFAAQVAEEHPDVNTTMRRRREDWNLRMVSERRLPAVDWRRARADLSSYPEPFLSRLLLYWNRHSWLPGTLVYLLGVLHMFNTVRLDLGAPGMCATEHLQGD